MNAGASFMGATVRTPTLFALLAAALSCALFAAPAQAQRARVFVASYGSDSNPCTFGSPCKTFQHAHDAVAARGEITAIDSAGFGPVSITKAVTITSPDGVEAGIAAASGGNAITVNAGTGDAVVLSGLTLEGAGTAAYGIYSTQAGELEIVNCAIRNYHTGGVYILAGNPMSVLISNSIISDVATGGQNGIYFESLIGDSILAALNHVTINDNFVGINVFANGAPVELQIADSHIDNNPNSGITLYGSSASAKANAILSNVTLNQSSFGIFIDQNASVWLSNVTQIGVPALNGTTGVYFGDPSTTAAFTDNTSHIMGGYSNGTPTTWTPN
jgi:hypothetical protein